MVEPIKPPFRTSWMSPRKWRNQY